VNKINRLKIEEGNRIYPPQKGETYFLGKLPLHWLVYYLSTIRNYNKELTIEYIRKNYDLDISDVISSISWWEWNDVNIYEEYTKRNPRKGFKTNERRYFTSRGRSYYIKFAITQWGFWKKDFINHFLETDVIHHIYPLVYGGTNHLENLIHVSSFNHDILHSNPLENIEKYNHQALNYLWYLQFPWTTEKNQYLFEKYNLDQMINHESKQYQANILSAAIKQEMNEFYEHIKENHK